MASKPQACPAPYNESLKSMRDFSKEKFKGSFLAFGKIPGNREARKTEANGVFCTPCLPTALHTPCLHSCHEQLEPEDGSRSRSSYCVQAASASSSGVLSSDPLWGTMPITRSGHTSLMCSIVITATIIHSLNNEGPQSNGSHRCGCSRRGRHRVFSNTRREKPALPGRAHFMQEILEQYPLRSLPGRKGHPRQKKATQTKAPRHEIEIT